MSGNSYYSSNDTVLHFGTGSATRTDQLEIRWPSGLQQKFSSIPGDSTVVVTEGEQQIRTVR